jgi:DNA-binding NarL/FixJ family response regulator
LWAVAAARTLYRGLSDPARKHEVRAALQRAVIDIERLEGREPRRGARDVIHQAWRGLVCGRWRLVDHFDADGRHYVVTTIAAGDAPSRPGAMSEREHEVLSRAASGLTNKEIAMELGLAQSTVRVLVHRAARKLGTVDRAEALARFRALCEGH